MKNCKNCGRTLDENEKNHCPACASSKSHKIKKIIEIATPIVIAIGGFALKLLRKK